ncbi:hypothetical protein [Paenibacillus protaetiae]|uniref:Uncharacterized protein n=1 Tax=Paenibacillus protaetiae TaxID=2509456 RepID=A0A4P6EWM3_9BACL|nr:hypothetical protein [Paenibacillus protaetiae]QAY66603.1 hypothetical protein ET464_09490 [Paenibacillus protaetiae]
MGGRNELLLDERQAKAELLASLAKSQHALARILDSVADVAQYSGETARHIGANIDLLTGLQQTIAEAVTGARLRRSVRMSGNPGKPWLNPLVRAQPRKLS